MNFIFFNSNEYSNDVINSEYSNSDYNIILDLGKSIFSVEQLVGYIINLYSNNNVWIGTKILDLTRNCEFNLNNYLSDFIKVEILSPDKNYRKEIILKLNSESENTFYFYLS